MMKPSRPTTHLPTSGSSQAPLCPCWLKSPSSSRSSRHNFPLRYCFYTEIGKESRRCNNSPYFESLNRQICCCIAVNWNSAVQQFFFICSHNLSDRRMTSPGKTWQGTSSSKEYRSASSLPLSNTYTITVLLIGLMIQYSRTPASLYRNSFRP